MSKNQKMNDFIRGRQPAQPVQPVATEDLAEWITTGQSTPRDPVDAGAGQRHENRPTVSDYMNRLIRERK